MLSVTPVVACSVNAEVVHSAYAARKLAKSVASLAFSNCDVKIGIAIATKTADGVLL